MKKSLLIFGLSIVFIPTSFTFGEEQKVYPCYPMAKQPILDGRIRDDDAWKNIPMATGFVKLGTDSFISKQTFFKIGYTPEALYVWVKLEEPEIKKVVAILKDMQDLWNEDSIEIFISPEGNEKYFQFIVNAIGSRWSREYVGVFIPAPEEMSLDSWQAATYKGEAYWSTELKIPFEVLKVSKPKSEEDWRGSLSRNIFTSGDRLSCWAHLKTHNHETDNFGKIIFKNKSLSPKEVEEIEKRINLPMENFLEEKIRKRIELFSGWEKDFLKISKNPEVISILKVYEEIKKALFAWEGLSLEEKRLLFGKSKSVFEKADKLRCEILLEDLF